MSKKEKTGRVVSTKMQKTIVVAVNEYKKHPKYGKYMRWTTKFKAHALEGTCREGDLVTIEECSPISKEKTWRLKVVVEQTQEL
ncbi:MAG: 30S ribosomal protein S17 [Vampirovibrionales bacterium]|jgi:small subunit ribosomal protein S17|nr:30S ribosomal protein S17 [Vampirovibrionales bacterium]